MKKIKVGVVGTGYTVGIASQHVNSYQKNSDCELVALYDIVPERAREWAKERGLEADICNSYEELLDKVDAVSICAPNYAHVDLSVKAIARGKHVLCEKPISTNAENAKEALNYSKCTDKVSMIGFSYRDIPAIRYMKQLIAEGKLGEIFTYRETLGGCRISNPGVKLEWRMQKDLSGTGALADFGCHMIDLCDWLIRETSGKPKSVNGFVGTAIGKRDKVFGEGVGEVTNDDYAAFNIKFESGAVASFLASRLGVARHTLEIYGSGGMILFRDDKPEELEVWFKETAGGYQGRMEIIPVPEELMENPYFTGEIHEFIQCIKTGRKPDRNFERALYIQKIIDTIELATEKGTSEEIA